MLRGMPIQVSTHASLIARLAAGDDSTAWPEFHARYAELITGFARRRGLQDADALDVAQDVLMAVSRNIGRIRIDPAVGRFRGYLKTIAIRALTRKQRRKEFLLLGDPEDPVVGDRVEQDPDLEDAWESEWRQYHLRLAMQRIQCEFSASDVLAFESLTIEGSNPAETAERLGMSADSVYQAKSRILKRLRVLVAEQTAEEG